MDSGLSLASFDEELEVDSIVAIEAPLPGTVLNYGLGRGPDAARHGEGLHHDAHGLVATLAFEQVEAGPEAEPTAVSRGGGRTMRRALGVGCWEGTLWCRSNTGSSLTAKPQLDVVVFARCCPMPFFGQLAGMVLALGGEGAALSVDEGLH